MPLNGNDSGATWQGPPGSSTSQPNPVPDKTNVPPQENHLDVSGITHASAQTVNDTWEPSREDNVPSASEAAFTPSNVTPIRPVPAAHPDAAGLTSSPTGTMPVPDNEDESEIPLHLMPDNVDITHGMQATQGTVHSPQRTPSRRSQIANQASYYSSLILVPFLFAVLTGLIVLPAVASSRAYLPTQALVPLIILLLVIAIAQGVGIYYAGTNNGIWVVCTISAFFLFLLVGCFALFGATATFILLVLILIAYVVLFRLYVHPVPTGYLEIVRAFGNYSRTLYSGFNILLPWEKVTQILSTSETTWKTPLQHVQVSPTEDVVLRGSIIYQLRPDEAHIAVLNVNKWEESLHDIFVARLQDVAGTFTQNFIAWLRKRNYIPNDDGTTPFIEGGSRWQQINSTLLQQMQSYVSQWGVLVKDVQIFDVALAAHSRYILPDDDTDPASYMRAAAPIPAPATASPKAEQPKQAEAQQTVVQPPASQPQPTKPSPPPGVFKEETLISAYRAVQNGAIKDPETIRNLASQFETVANDPVLYQKVNFDALRAAYNLLKEADRQEAELAARAGTLFNEETNPDFRRPNVNTEDESSLLGG